MDKENKVISDLIPPIITIKGGNIKIEYMHENDENGKKIPTELKIIDLEEDVIVYLHKNNDKLVFLEIQDLRKDKEMFNG